MIQKKLFFIVVVFGLLFSGGVSGRPGDGKWTLQGCCTIEAFHECWGPWLYPDQASCLAMARKGIAECRAGAAENQAHSIKITGGCTYNGNEEEEKDKCLDECASFYVCTWENGMCIKRVRAENEYINSDNPLHIDNPTTTLSGLGDNERFHPMDSLEQKHRCLDHCPADFVCSYVSGSGCTQTLKSRLTTTTITGSTVTTVTTKTTTTTLSSGHNIDELEPYQTYEDNSEYCGPENNNFIMSLVPRGPPQSGSDFNPACYGHDKCYSECERTQDTKASCDSAFLKRMDQTCQTTAAKDPCPKRDWYNPLGYTCPVASALGETYCRVGARGYWLAVAGLANCFDAYPCRERMISWVPCT